jgi:excisionase family DNA binding protein
MVDRETYLKTQQLADALGVSISSIKRWVDKGEIEATKTTGKHRLVALSTALKFAREGKYPTEGLLALSETPRIAEIDASVIDHLLEAMKIGDARKASALITAAFHLDRDAANLADNLIRPVMTQIGKLWFVGAIDIYQEHQATQIVVASLLNLIRGLSRDPSPDAPLAIGAAPEGDIYSLPVLLGEFVLKSLGWDVKNLGSNLPFRSMAKAIRSYRPKLVFLSTSIVTDRELFLQEYSYFYEAASQVGAAIMLGGRALDGDLRSKLVYASFGDRMAHLAEFARRLHATSGSNRADGANQSESTDFSN